MDWDGYDTDDTEKFIFDHQWDWCSHEAFPLASDDVYPFMLATPPPLYKTDKDVHKLNARVWRLVMLADMRFWPGYTHLEASGDDLGPLRGIDGRPWRQSIGITLKRN